MRKKLPSWQGDISAAAQWIERLTEVLMLVPLCVLAKSALFALVPVMFLNRLIVDVFCVHLPFVLEKMFAMILAKKNKRKFIAVHVSLRQELMVAGILCGGILAIAVPVLSSFVLGDQAPVEDLNLMKCALWCFTPVIVVDAMLAVHRGMDLTVSKSKGFLFRWILEQGLRLAAMIIFILAAGKGADSVLSIVLAVLAVGLPALGLLVYYEKYDNVMLLGQPGPMNANVKAMFNRRAVPHVMTVISEELWLIPPVFLSLPLVVHFGMEYGVAKQLYGLGSMMQMFMVLIPALLMFGTVLHVKGSLQSAGNLPQEQKGQRIESALNKAIKWIMPAGMFLMLESKPLLHVLFQIDDPASAGLLAGCGLLAVVYSGASFTSQVMDAMDLKALRNQYCWLAFVFQLVGFYPLVKQYGFAGVIYADILFFAVLLFMNLAKIKNRSIVSMRKVGSVLVRTVIAGFAMHGAVYGLSLLGLTGMQKDLVQAIGSLSVMIAVGGAAYYMTGDIVKIFRFRRIVND